MGNSAAAEYHDFLVSPRSFLYNTYFFLLRICVISSDSDVEKFIRGRCNLQYSFQRAFLQTFLENDIFYSHLFTLGVLFLEAVHIRILL